MKYDTFLCSKLESELCAGALNARFRPNSRHEMDKMKEIIK